MHSVRVASCILLASVHLKVHTLVERAIAEKEATGEEPKIFLTERGQVRFCIYLNEISTSCPDRRDTGAPVRTQARYGTQEEGATVETGITRGQCGRSNL
jgi:hypothetical protein